MAGRDAMVFYDGVRTRYLIYNTATNADGRACLALAQSSNLIDWHDLGPTYIEEDRSYNRLESAYLVEQGGRYYLFYSAKGGPKSKGFSPDEFAHFDIVYLVSDDPTGGWVKPPNHELLLGTTCASEHPTLDGVTYMLYIIQEEIDGIWGASSLSDPKRIEWLADGTVQIREHLPVNTQHQVLFDQLSMSFAGWVQHGGEWLVERDEVTVSSPAADSFLMNTLWGNDLAIEAKIWVESTGAASLLVRSNPSALAGYRIGLDFVHRTIGLFVRFPTRPDQLLQQRSIDLKTGQWCKLKVVVQGAFFDVYVDDALVLVRHHRLYEAGCFGLHTREDVRFRSIHAYHPPPLKRADPEWQQRCLPRNWFPNR